MWWVNGESTDLISAADRGLAYGDGLFETMRVVENNIPLFDSHMFRLTLGAERLGLPFASKDVEKAVDQAIHWAAETGQNQSVIKLILTRSGASAGYGVGKNQLNPETGKATSANILLRLSEFHPSAETISLRVKLCNYILTTQPMLAGIKHLNRLDQIMASQELGDEEDEGLLLDNRGFVAEGISNNFFLVKGSEISTPKMNEYGVKGVMRDFLLQHLASIKGLNVQERDIPSSELESADEMLLTNAVRGVRNIRSISGMWESKGTDIGDSLRSLLSAKLGSEFTSC